MSHSFVLCPTCDTQVAFNALPSGIRAYCPCCGSEVYHRPHEDQRTLLALVITAFLCYFPANFLPVLEIELLGNIRQATIYHGALTMINDGFILVGITVLVSGVIAPLLLLGSILAQLLLILYPVNRPLLGWLLRQQSWLQKASMVEIYLISYLVAVFKLSDFTHVTFGWGSVSLVLLFVMTAYVLYEYNFDDMWHQYDIQKR